jgi:hypothetical protein
MTAPLALEHLRAMSPEEVNRRIAEHCGWTECYTAGGIAYGYAPAKDYPHASSPPVKRGHHKSAPNYFASLDVMAQAEATLTDEEHWRFRGILRAITGPKPERAMTHAEWDRAYVSAPANVRALAFIMAKEGAR